MNSHIDKLYTELTEVRARIESLETNENKEHQLNARVLIVEQNLEKTTDHVRQLLTELSSLANSHHGI